MREMTAEKAKNLTKKYTKREQENEQAINISEDLLLLASSSTCL